MSRLLQLRDAIVEAIKAAVAGVDVSGHLGRFDEKELLDFMAKAPAARVAILGLENPRAVSDDGVDYDAIVGIYVVTKDGAVRMDRDEAALAMVEQIMRLANRTRWGLAGGFCKLSERATARNLYTRSLTDKGVALWAIDLRQPIRLASPACEAVPFPRLFLGVAPEIGVGHEGDYLGLADA